MIAAIFWPPATSLSMSETTDGGSVDRTDPDACAEVMDECGAAIEDDTAVACDLAKPCGATLVADQWSILSFASLRPKLVC